MQPDSKKRKINGESSLSTPSAPSEYKDTAKTSRDNWKTSSINTRIQQAKNFAVAQAQQEGCTGNYRIFDSPFGNFLVPVLPTRAELSE